MSIDKKSNKSVLEFLSELDFVHRYIGKSLPAHAKTKKKYKDTTANDLTNCVIDFLAVKGHYGVRINVVGIFDKSIGKYRTSNTERGTADIHACINGYHVSIEVKVGKDVMSPQQEKVKLKVEKSGGVYLVIKDFAGFYEWYEGYCSPNLGNYPGM